eukprot:scaffold4964_cov248-Ochromonas_danica.AAC.7
MAEEVQSMSALRATHSATLLLTTISVLQHTILKSQNAEKNPFLMHCSHLPKAHHSIPLTRTSGQIKRKAIALTNTPGQGTSQHSPHLHIRTGDQNTGEDAQHQENTKSIPFLVSTILSGNRTFFARKNILRIK